MSRDTIETDTSRRSFLKAAAGTAIAATAAGAGAAILVEELQKTSSKLPVVTSPSTSEPVLTTGGGSQQLSKLMSDLAAARVENVRLQTQLSGAQQHLQLLQAQTATPDTSVADSLQQQLDDANTQVGALSGQVSLLGGLVALYEQLDEINLEAIASEGVATVGDLVQGLADRVPTVNEGLQAGHQALAEFEQQIPLVESGRRWLAEQINLIGTDYGNLELVLQNTLKATGSLIQMLSDWFEDVLKWLPFGLGRKASEIMDAISRVVIETPETISGLQTKVAHPLDLWLAKEGDETPLQRKLIKPIRDQGLNQAAEALSQVEVVQMAYHERLLDPVQSAAQRRNEIRTLIAEYRQEHQL